MIARGISQAIVLIFLIIVAVIIGIFFLQWFPSLFRSQTRFGVIALTSYQFIPGSKVFVEVELKNVGSEIVRVISVELEYTNGTLIGELEPPLGVAVLNPGDSTTFSAFLDPSKVAPGQSYILVVEFQADSRPPTQQAFKLAWR